MDIRFDRSRLIDGTHVTSGSVSLRHRVRLIVVGLLTAASLTTGVIGFVPTAARADGNVSAFLAHLNGLRAARGLPQLSLNGELSSIAAGHTQAMAAQGKIFHNPSLQNQVTNWQTLGENVGMGPTPADIDNAFDHSPDHYANETNSTYTQVGIASTTTSNGEIYVTLDFRMPMNGGAPTQTTQPNVPTQTAATNGTTRAVARQSGATRTSDTISLAAQAVALAAHRAAVTRATRAAATAAARSQAARLTPQLTQGTDPVARAMVFAARVNSIG